MLDLWNKEYRISVITILGTLKEKNVDSTKEQGVMETLRKNQKEMSEVKKHCSRKEDLWQACQWT